MLFPARATLLLNSIHSQLLFITMSSQMAASIPRSSLWVTREIFPSRGSSGCSSGTLIQQATTTIRCGSAILWVKSLRHNQNSFDTELRLSYLASRNLQGSLSTQMSIDQASLKRRVFNASAWSLAGYAISFVIRFGSNLVMTRLLAPSMFGVVAIAQLIMVGLALFSDVGLRPSVIQSKRGDDPAFLNTVWTTQILRGFILWSAGLFISLLIYLSSRFGLAPVSSVYSNPTLPYVVAVISLASIISSFESTKTMEAGRSLSLGSLTKIDLFSQIVGLAVMLAWGIADPSIWALIAGSIASVSARTVVSHFWLSGVTNRLHFEREAFREIIRFWKMDISFIDFVLFR